VGRFGRRAALVGPSKVARGVATTGGPWRGRPENDPDGPGVFGAPMRICVCPESRKRFAVRGLLK